MIAMSQILLSHYHNITIFVTSNFYTTLLLPALLVFHGRCGAQYCTEHKKWHVFTLTTHGVFLAHFIANPALTSKP
jgi:hypothetical protein